MNYYIKEIQNDNGIVHTAGIKARDDINDICEMRGVEKILLTYDKSREGSIFSKITSHITVKKMWKENVKKLKGGDCLYVQFPPVNHSLLLSSVFKNLRKKGVKIIALIHDLDSFRTASRKDISFKRKIRVKLEETSLLKNCTKIVAHNNKMVEAMIKMGFDKDALVSLGIFDYLINDYDARINEVPHREKDYPVIIAGALRKHKTKYLADLPADVQFNLYGVGYEDDGKSNIKYHGSFPPDELAYVLEGSFGLVWDGDSISGCTGVYGEYLRINNPHKTSLYIASGIPVIIWKEAALASFIEEHKLGIAVESLDEIKKRIDAMTEQEYEEILLNVKREGEKFRKGFYFGRVINKYSAI